MKITALRSKTPAEVHAAITAFAQRYVEDWNQWLACEESNRANVFGSILRRWQATRPLAMRRTAREAQHPAPYIDDLMRRSEHYTAQVSSLSTRSIRARTKEQNAALSELWRIFEELPRNGCASCVGITKAILLQTNGSIGPALDSKVRGQIGVLAPTCAGQWTDILDLVAEDIQAFEEKHGRLNDHVPNEFAHLGVGRLYDMLLGPGARG
jgi:hypothetical protein